MREKRKPFLSPGELRSDHDVVNMFVDRKDPVPGRNAPIVPIGIEFQADPTVEVVGSRCFPAVEVGAWFVKVGVSAEQLVFRSFLRLNSRGKRQNSENNQQTSHAISSTTQIGTARGRNLLRILECGWDAAELLDGCFLRDELLFAG